MGDAAEVPMMKEEIVEKTFKDLGVNNQLIEACDTLGWKNPTKIQCEAIPLALEGKDVIGLTQTGSGKTGAFAIPIIQSLLEAPQAFFACVLSPTRELAIQIAEQFEALGAGIGLKCAVLVGGVNQVQQSIALGKRPHIVESGSAPDKDEEEKEILHISAKSAIVFVITASTFLLLLYFFMSSWFIWLLIVLFCIGGIEGMHNCIVSLVLSKFRGSEQKKMNLPLLGEVSIFSLAVLIFCVVNLLLLGLLPGRSPTLGLDKTSYS